MKIEREAWSNNYKYGNKTIKVILGCVDKTHNLEAVLLVLMERQNISGTSYVIGTI